MPKADLRIERLRCEYLVDPEGIDETRPRLSWELASRRRGVRQAAYRVLCAGTAKGLRAGADDLMWDSGRVQSAQAAQIEYAGRPLRSRQRVFWKVQVWDDSGASKVSAPAGWSMGLLKPADWKARWIAADQQIIARDDATSEGTPTESGTPALFRKEFGSRGRPVRATVYATARGVFYLYLNGRRVGEDLFAPEWTDYHRRIQYRTYDVTDRVVAGENAIGAALGDGWWSGFLGWQEKRGRYGSLENSLLVQLELEYRDGSRVIVGSGDDWSCNTGPILSSDFQMGEIYDARRERPGWDRPRFKATDWLAAKVVAAPRAKLVAQRSDPIRRLHLIKPSVWLPSPSAEAKRTAGGQPDTFQPPLAGGTAKPQPSRKGVRLPSGGDAGLGNEGGSQTPWIINLGQNIAGWIRLRVKAPAGTRITLRHGERLSPDGTLYTENLRRAKATDVYICRGGGVETWEPHFTFHGFQYVEVTGLPSAPKRGDITGVAIHSATPPAGEFSCSHPGVNRLWLNGVWSQRDNFISVPTDCPQRDERLGWTGDAQVFLRTASYNCDVAAFFTKWMVDVEDAQTPEGIFPDIAPRLDETKDWKGLDGLAGAAGWADCGIIVPWTLWRVYGDRRIIERHWDAMVAWLDYLEKTNPDGLRTRDLGNNYGDWLCIPSDTTFRTHSPMKNLLATAYWADDARKLARMARELGRTGDERRFQAMFERVRAAFRKAFVGDNGKLAVETQTAYVLVLLMDLIPDAMRAGAAERLVDDIRRLGWHLSTGFIGISHLNPVLTLSGHADVAHRLLLQDDYPSWLYPVQHGATTIWERWNGWTHQDGFFEPSMNSFNHYSLGSVGEWLYRHVAGIELDPEVPGFRKFLLRPWPGAGLTHARATYHSMAGEISSAWKRSGRRFDWTVRIPANTTARVHVPADPGTEVVGPRQGVAGRDNRSAIYELGSGTYRFRSQLTL